MLLPRMISNSTVLERAIDPLGGKLYDHDWKYTITREKYTIIFSEYMIYYLKLYDLKRYWFPFCGGLVIGPRNKLNVYPCFNIKVSQLKMTRLWNIEYVKYRLFAFLAEPIFKVQTLQIFFFVISEIWFFSNSKSSKSKIQKIRKNSSPASKTFVVYFLSYAAYSIPLWFQSRKIFISRRGARFARNWSIFLSFINKRLLEIDSSLISCQDVHHGAFSPRDGILENQTWKSPK